MRGPAPWPCKPTPQMTRDLKAGQRLVCDECGSEIEIVQPCTCNPPDQVLRCCGKDMQPTVACRS